MTPAGGVATGTPDLLARPLDEVPEVTHTLRSFGLGELIPHTVVARVGRNDNWSGTTTTGEHVVVKRLSGPAVDVARRRSRLVRFESWARGGVFGSLRTPACLGWDESAAVFVHREVRDARPGNELMVEQTFTEEQSAQVGRAVAELHEAQLASDPRWDTDADLLPSPRLLAALPLELVRGCSAAQLQAWSLLQHDDAVKTAVLNLLSEGRRVLWVPSHCDLRVDQVLLDAQGPVVCDWEEFRLADPARDVGSYVGEWIYPPSSTSRRGGGRGLPTRTTSTPPPSWPAAWTASPPSVRSSRPSGGRTRPTAVPTRAWRSGRRPLPAGTCSTGCWPGPCRHPGCSRFSAPRQASAVAPCCPRSGSLARSA